MILNGKLVETNECPEDTFILLNPRYHPITGELDIEETAKASMVVTNIGKETQNASDKQGSSSNSEDH
jgi:hypothetical protein